MNLRERCRESDLVARLGGDEFAILVEDCSGHRGEINALASGLISLVTAAAQSVCPDVPVGASVGVAGFNQSGPALSQLMAQADDAMYRAKRGGKNTVAFSE
jgi:diguanylate cyclase (GGDEF)-like protein